jgi:hypothetical protein
MKDEGKAAPWKKLARAAGGGALVGALVPLVNVYFQGQLAAVGLANLATMMVGGAVGGAILFTGIALVVRLLSRSR